MTLLCGLLVLAALACGSLAAAELLDKDPALLALPVLAAGIVGLVCVLWNRGRKRYESAN